MWLLLLMGTSYVLRGPKDWPIPDPLPVWERETGEGFVHVPPRTDEPGWQIHHGWLSSERGLEARVPIESVVVRPLDEGVVLLAGTRVLVFRQGVLQGWDLEDELVIAEVDGTRQLAANHVLDWIPGQDQFRRTPKVGTLLWPGELRQSPHRPEPLLVGPGLVAVRDGGGHHVFALEDLSRGPRAYLDGHLRALGEDAALVSREDMELWRVDTEGHELLWRAHRRTSPDGRWHASAPEGRLTLSGPDPDSHHVIEEAPSGAVFLTDELAIVPGRAGIQAWSLDRARAVQLPVEQGVFQDGPGIETSHGPTYLGTSSEGGWFVVTEEDLWGEDPAEELVRIHPDGSAEVAMSRRPLVTAIQWREPILIGPAFSARPMLGGGR